MIMVRETRFVEDVSNATKNISEMLSLLYSCCFFFFLAVSSATHVVNAVLILSCLAMEMKATLPLIKLENSWLVSWMAKRHFSIAT